MKSPVYLAWWWQEVLAVRVGMGQDVQIKEGKWAFLSHAQGIIPRLVACYMAAKVSCT